MKILFIGSILFLSLISGLALTPARRPAERPQIFVLDTRLPQFAGLVEETRQAKGADFSICDVEVPVKVVSLGTAAAPVGAHITDPISRSSRRKPIGANFGAPLPLPASGERVG